MLNFFHVVGTEIVNNSFFDSVRDGAELGLSNDFQEFNQGALTQNC